MSGQIDEAEVARMKLDITSPVGWKHQQFWMTRGKRVFGVVLAFSPTTLAIGGELFGSKDTARGFALFLGPLWVGLATLRSQARP